MLPLHHPLNTTHDILQIFSHVGVLRGGIITLAATQIKDS